ncbi:MAG TPA: helix-turn-helix transcriptional regulator [Pirellulales bacterium]|jgi:transcriptional regulator with XRE-family HTH domain|nr:helix-turn-helix transcriptional regulator [Pirellulales bacterium]
MKTKNFAEVIRAELRCDPQLAQAVEAETFNAAIAQKLYDLRVQHGLTQLEFAARIGSHQSAIARMEDADYAGHSLSLLLKIAEAFGKELRVEFIDKFVPDRGAVGATSISVFRYEEMLTAPERKWSGDVKPSADCPSNTTYGVGA